MGAGERKKTCNFQGCPKTKLFSDAKCPELFFFYLQKTKCHNKKPKQRYSARCHVLYAVWKGGYLQAGSRD